MLTKSTNFVCILIGGKQEFATEESLFAIFYVTLLNTDEFVQNLKKYPWT